MMGHNHMLTGVSATVAGAAVVHAAMNEPVFAEPLNQFVEFVWTKPSGGRDLVWAMVAASLVLLGSLLPDIDHDKSFLGRYVHLNVPHRTWTHAIWWPLLLFALSSKWPLLFWVGLGWLVHEVFDNMSKAGVCFLYPITKPITYAINSQGKIYRAKKGTNPPKSFRIKKNHKVWFYKAGNYSETIVSCVSCASCFILSGFLFWKFPLM